MTKYTYREPRRGTESTSRPPINPYGVHNVIAYLHTHAAYDSRYKNDVFSKRDIENAKHRGLVSYVATPLGTLRRYNPVDETDIIIYDDIPFDSHHPGR